MGRDFDERGQIINEPEPRTGYSPPARPYSGEGERGTFMAVTLITSPIIYSVVGTLLNDWLEFGRGSGDSLMLGGLFGLVVTAIYNFAYAEEYTAKDYVSSLGLPALVLIVIGIGLVVLAIVIALVLVGIFLGGG